MTDNVLTEGLTLFTAGLFSKWGFSDGDCPDRVYDWCDDADMLEPGRGSWSWHDVLVDLVTTHLVPWLDGRVEVYEIVTSHNPIRARSVDGVNVDHTAGVDGNSALVARLPVASVDVSREAVLATIRRHQAANRGGSPC